MSVERADDEHLAPGLPTDRPQRQGERNAKDEQGVVPGDGQGHHRGHGERRKDRDRKHE